VLRVLERAFANLEPRAPGAVDVIVAGLTGFDGAPETASAVAAAGTGVMALAGARDGSFARSDG
jgi:hypothetical protein